MFMIPGLYWMWPGTRNRRFCAGFFMFVSKNAGKNAVYGVNLP